MDYAKLNNADLLDEGRRYINRGTARIAEYQRRVGAGIDHQPEPVAEEPPAEPEPTPDPVDPEPVDPNEPVDPSTPEPTPKEIPLGRWIKAEEEPEIAVLSDAEIDKWLVGARIPADNKTDPVGAFRFHGNATHLGRFDPIVYKGEDGRGEEDVGHLHTFANNDGVTGFSTYESIRKTGSGSSIGGALNKTAEWATTLTAIDNETGKRVPLFPNRIGRYYKAIPDYSQWDAISARSPEFAAWIAKQSDRQLEFYRQTPLVDMPAGMRFIPGYRYGLGAFRNKLFRGGKEIAKSHHFADLDIQANDTIVMNITAPDHWDGVHIDSPDHISHVVHPKRDRNYWALIPRDGWKRINTMTANWNYTIPASVDPKTLAYSSDLELGQPAGSTAHFGYIEGFEPRIRRRWFEGAIQGHRNCSDFNLGDGAMAVRPADFDYEHDPRSVHWDSSFY